MKRYALSALMFFALTSAALAQEAPVPHKMPRTPVHREPIAGAGHAFPASREIAGQAIIIDGEKLRIGDIDMRLFGVVPPQLSASFGPQARAALDEVTNGQTVNCTIRDRDREERFLATCRSAGNVDLALELLRRGLAVVARGSVATTELAASYLAAEQAAAAQRTGVWSVAVPMAASMPAPMLAPVAPTAPAVLPNADTTHKLAEEKPLQAAVKSEPPKTVVAEPQAKPAWSQAPALAPSMVDVSHDSELSREPGFLARYQLLVTGILMLLTAFGTFAAFMFQRMRERRSEMQAIAAALRGELMAARSVCLARIRAATEIEDKDIVWPRIRATLYQAYVGRIGWLGAELARRVASIYGQASYYAAYYDAGDGSRVVTMPKRQALQALAQHIDDVLPRLAVIEHTGNPGTGRMNPGKPAAAIAAPSASHSSGQPAALTARPSASTTPDLSPATVDAAAISGETAGGQAGFGVGPAHLWTVMRKFARGPWGERKESAANDPIAEYTALIEEEMKRFSFQEGEEGVEPEASPQEPSNAWTPKSGAL
ncbi:MAG: thermonuclease family protein [Pseudomonadota bacterium]|nr:thermonuclease family protein [Pseudomonadota bacterium]